MSKFRLLLVLAVLTGLAHCPAGRSHRERRRVRAAPSRRFRPFQLPRFARSNYEVRASLDAIGQVMNAQAKVDFAASDVRRE